MDWYVPNDTAAATALRLEVRALLARHCAEGSDVDGAVLVLSELVTNAMRYSNEAIWVSLDWGAPQPVVTVHDLGAGFSLPDTAMPVESLAVTGRGLRIVTHLTDQLSVRAKSAGGSSVRAVLPVQRRVSDDHDPAPSVLDPLPDLSEADEHGHFGREAFLRALVVHLAQTVELRHGPTDSEAVVAQVGSDVGSQMESAYRIADDVSTKLSTDQIAELFVQLKAAIGGDFFVIEANEDRIVLGNRACPFGDVVTRAPALCRMTSSVFGGIASRNRGGAAVDLEERIAVGDAQCRVTVWLRPPPADRAAHLHLYGSFRRHLTGGADQGDG